MSEAAVLMVLFNSGFVSGQSMAFCSQPLLGIFYCQATDNLVFSERYFLMRCRCGFRLFWYAAVSWLTSLRSNLMLYSILLFHGGSPWCFLFVLGRTCSCTVRAAAYTRLLVVSRVLVGVCWIAEFASCNARCRFGVGFNLRSWILSSITLKRAMLSRIICTIDPTSGGKEGLLPGAFLQHLAIVRCNTR